MAKKLVAKMGEVKNQDSESGVRANLEEVEETIDERTQAEKEVAEAPAISVAAAEAEAKDMTPDELAHHHLDKLTEKLAVLDERSSEDKAHADHRIDRIHYHVVKEMAERKAKGKRLVFSDGNREMLHLLHKKIC